MPIREYKCTKCSNITEVIQNINENPLEFCPKCGGKLEKLISNTSFILKGSGWYKTDYGSSGIKPAGSGKPAKAAENKTSENAMPACSACAAGTEKCTQN